MRAVVALLRNKPARVRERYRDAEPGDDCPALSSVVLFGLWHGVAKSGHIQENTERRRIPLSGDLTVVTANTGGFHRVTGLKWQDWTI